MKGALSSKVWIVCVSVVFEMGPVFDSWLRSCRVTLSSRGSSFMTVALPSGGC